MALEFSSKITQTKTRKKKKGSLVKEKTFNVTVTVKKIETKEDAENFERKIEQFITKEAGQALLD